MFSGAEMVSRFIISDAETRDFARKMLGAYMLMPDERSMAQRERFETKGYNPSRDSIEMSQGATLASEASGLHES